MSPFGPFIGQDTKHQQRDRDRSDDIAEFGLADYNAKDGGGQRQHDCHKRQPKGQAQLHRSTSPNTMSRALSTAVVSASMWPRIMKSIAWRCEKPVGRILQR